MLGDRRCEPSQPKLDLRPHTTSGRIRVHRVFTERMQGSIVVLLLMRHDLCFRYLLIYCKIKLTGQIEQQKQDGLVKDFEISSVCLSISGLRPNALTDCIGYMNIYTVLSIFNFYPLKEIKMVAAPIVSV